MDKIKRYIKYRKKSYLLNTALFIAVFIVAILIFGPPRYYAVPILSMIIGFGLVEFVGYKGWKKDEF
ncbi:MULTISPECIES: hypothetical protein [Peribacillus]|uniref:Uncharacterized protein n=1 Tax=Peribacillus simplex TaxID=1478 RepID=A0A125QSJ6_9BACI|nr:hypothetical protein [Peribacillus simplex]KWW21927.1 hypothetical protein AS888_05440 [Peribacillus simplex]